MSDFLQQMLNDEEHNRKLTDAHQRACVEYWKEKARITKEGFVYETCVGESQKENELIPCTPELERLKEFLASFKKPALRYAGEWVVGLGPEEEKWKRIAGY